MNKCPACESGMIVEGTFPQGGGGFFRPKKTKAFWWGFPKDPNVKMRDTAFKACLGCGLLWNTIDPSELAKVVYRFCKKDFKEQLKNQAREETGG